MGLNPRIITFQSAKGGVGCSILASNTAIAIAYETKKPVCLLEFDVIHGGSQALLMNFEPELVKAKNLNELLKLGKVTHETFLHNLVKHPKANLNLLSAETSEELESLTANQVIEIISTAGTIFENIVVDLAQPYISEELVTTFDFSSVVCLVMTPDIVTFEHTQKFLDLMKDLNFDASKFQIVLNMAGVSKTELDVDTIESYMERKVFTKIPFDIQNTMSSVNTGIPLLQTPANLEITYALYDLGRKLISTKPTNLTEAIKTAVETSKKFGSTEHHSNFMSEKSLVVVNESGTSSHQVATNVVKSSAASTLYGLDRETYKKIKQITHKQLVSEMRLDRLSHIDLTDPAKKEELKNQIIERIGSIFDTQGFMFKSRTDRADLIRELANEALGLGPLEDILSDPTITEVMVNGIDQIYVEQLGKIKLLNRNFTDEKQLRVVIDRIVNPIGRRIDESSPYVDARLADGSRVNIIIPPLAIDGPSITIRKFPSKRLIMEDFIQYETLTKDMAEFLASCVIAKMNIFISGGTGSGKTTLLNILSSFIPNDERIVTIEDAAELRLHQDHVVRLESKPPNIEGKGAVTIRDLVKNSLRMRPDRIVVGEIRGGEALDMLQAMNTGHDGSLATGHANTPRDALSRIETMVLMAGVEIPIKAVREQITAAINIIVQQNRMRDGSRKITKIVEVTGMEGDIISTQDIFTYDLKGVDERGKVIGSFNCSKIRPKILDTFEAKGSKLPAVFTPERVIARLRENK